MDIFVNDARETINVHLGGNSGHISVEYDMGSQDKANIWFVMRDKDLMLVFENKINDAISKSFEHFINNISSRYDIGKLIKDRAKAIMTRGYVDGTERDYIEKDMKDIINSYINSYFGDLFRKEFEKYGYDTSAL